MQVHEAIEQAVAEEFVRLQGSTFQQIIAAAQAQAQALSAGTTALAQQAQEAWERAAETAAHHLFVTLRVNPDRPLASLLAQPDVQAVLRRPFEQATDATRQAIMDAWALGEAHGFVAANQDLQIAGLAPVGAVAVNQDRLAQLLADATANGAAATQRFMDAIQTNDPEAVRAALLAVGASQALRAYAGADVAGILAAGEMKEEALQQAAQEQGLTMYKVWLAQLDAHTCLFCRALHGTRKKVGQAFGTTVWGGPLMHEPYHPRCRCNVILHLAAFNDEEGPTPQSMRGIAGA